MPRDAVALCRPSPAAVAVVEPAAVTTAPLAIWQSMAPLRGVAMLLVIANHAVQAAGGAYVGTRATVSPEQTPVAFATLAVLRSLTPACLLAFVFASGFGAYRFMRAPQHARSAVSQLLRKYLIWSVAALAFAVLVKRRFDGLAILEHLALGTAMPAYWFLTLLMPLSLLSPWFAHFVQRRPRAALVTALLLQIASSGLFYGFEPVEYKPGFWMLFGVRPMRFLPAFLAGMLVSRDAERVACWLGAQRRWLVGTALFAAAGCLFEATIVGRAAKFSVAAMTRMYAAERASLLLFATAAIAALLTSRFGGKAPQAWLTRIGNSSLGILFLMDACMMVVVVAAWQLPRFMWSEAAAAFARHELPAAIADHALWLTPLLFAVGLWGPLRIMDLARKQLGNRVRWLW